MLGKSGIKIEEQQFLGFHLRRILHRIKFGRIGGKAYLDHIVDIPAHRLGQPEVQETVAIYVINFLACAEKRHRIWRPACPDADLPLETGQHMGIPYIRRLRLFAGMTGPGRKRHVTQLYSGGRSAAYKGFLAGGHPVLEQGYLPVEVGMHVTGSGRAYVRKEVAAQRPGCDEFLHEPAEGTEDAFGVVAPSASFACPYMTMLPPLRGHICRSNTLERSGEIPYPHGGSSGVVGIHYVRPAVIDYDIRLQAAYPRVDLLRAEFLRLDSVPTHSVEPEKVDFPVIREEFLQLGEHIREEHLEVLAVPDRILNRSALSPCGHVPFGIGTVSGIMPVARREIESHLQSEFAAGIHIFTDKVPPVHILLDADAVARGPEGIAVVVPGGQHGIFEACFACGAQIMPEEIRILRVEMISLIVVFLAGMILPSPFVILYHIPRRLGAYHGMYPPMEEKAEAGGREPLRTRRRIRKYQIAVRRPRT